MKLNTLQLKLEKVKIELINRRDVLRDLEEEITILMDDVDNAIENLDEAKAAIINASDALSKTL